MYRWSGGIDAKESIFLVLSFLSFSLVFSTITILEINVEWNFGILQQSLQCVLFGFVCDMCVYIYNIYIPKSVCFTLYFVVDSHISRLV